MTTRRNAFTLVECLVVVAILFTLAGLIAPAFMAASRHSGDQHETSEPEEAWSLVTRVHDGHWWVIDRKAGYFVHHPDCPCKSRKAESESIR